MGKVKKINEDEILEKFEELKLDEKNLSKQKTKLELELDRLEEELNELEEDLSKDLGKDISINSEEDLEDLELIKKDYLKKANELIEEIEELEKDG